MGSLFKKDYTKILSFCIFIFCTFYTLSCEKKGTDSNGQVGSLIPGVSYLGCGYNVFGEYAAIIDVKDRIIEFDQYKTQEARGSIYDLPSEVQYLYLNDYTYNSTYGEYSYQYREKMSQSVGMSASYGFFGASVTANFSEEKYQSFDYAFCTIHRCVRFWKLSLPYTDLQALRSMMSAEARDDLTNLAPAVLFTKYGTHFTTEVIIGARADYHCEIEKTEESKTIKTRITACAEASFKKFTGSTDYIGVTESELQTFSSNSTQHLRVTGGKAEYGLLISEKGDYEEWMNSIEENPVLCDFTESSLVPIWDLCEDNARKQQLIAEFESYAGNFGLPELLNKSIVDIRIISGGTSGIDPDEGYEIIRTDLNRDAGGKYIYITYKEGLDNQESITDVTFVTGRGASAPGGYTKIPGDLNEGAGGAYVYLCYKTGISDYPIRRLTVLVGKNTQSPPGFYKVNNYYSNSPQDLNEGAGGNYIWLAYSRENPGAWEE